MGTNGSSTGQRTGLREPVRNHFFYGKLMDVYHYELETSYFVGMRRLLNRLVTSYGVICGLDVKKPDPKQNQIVVTRGEAIDKWGREIIVPHSTAPIPVPAELWPSQEGRATGNETADEVFIHVVICYHECKSDPTPILTGDCDDWGTCAPSTIRERYRIEFRRGKAVPPAIIDECRIPDVIANGTLDYAALTKCVTRSCPEFPAEACIPLANIHLAASPEGYTFDQDDIDITVRPIVFTNDLLFILLMSALTENPRYMRGK